MDNVNHPSHYADGAIEVIDYIRDKLTSQGFTEIRQSMEKERRRRRFEKSCGVSWMDDRVCNQRNKRKGIKIWTREQPRFYSDLYAANVKSLYRKK